MAKILFKAQKIIRLKDETTGITQPSAYAKPIFEVTEECSNVPAARKRMEEILEEKGLKPRSISVSSNQVTAYVNDPDLEPKARETGRKKKHKP